MGAGEHAAGLGGARADHPDFDARFRRDGDTGGHCARNCRELADVVALVLGKALFPRAGMLNSGVDILVSGVSAGTIAYGVHRWRAGA